MGAMVRRWRAVAVVVSLGVMMGPGAMVGVDEAWAGPGENGVAAKSGEGKKGLDRIILKSGKVVEGEILEETATTVRIRVIVAGISAPTIYQKSEVLEIRRAASESESKAEEGSVTKEVVRADSKGAPGGSGSARSGKVEKKKQVIEAGAARMYVVKLNGRFGVDVSETPLRQMFEDVDKVFGDLVDGVGAEAGRKVVDASVRSEHIVVLRVQMGSQPGFGTIFRTAELSPIVMNEMVEKGRRVVFWVDRATGGAAFLPWVSPEMYFTDNGKLGGIADLDDFSSGDHMVDEKLISAFLGIAEGFAIKGGYADHLPALRAMLRRQNWLVVKFEGGRPVYLTRRPAESDGDGWVVLSDNAEGENKDKDSQKGNDTFLLEAEWAVKLGIAKGRAETTDDLAFAMGVQRNFAVLEETRGQKIFDDWHDRIESTISQINPKEAPGLPVGRLWRDFAEIQVGGDFAQRKRDRGRKIALLTQIRSLMSLYAEVFDPKGVERAQIDLQIDGLRQEAQQDAQANRGGAGP